MQGLALVEQIRRFAMPEGVIECRGTWLRQRGEMRFARDRPWLPFEAEQWFEGSGIDFRWHACVRIAPFVSARVVDSFLQGRGELTARVLGIIPVARSSGPATDRGEALRGLAELPWRPFVFGDAKSFTWEMAGPNNLHATFDDGRTRASCDFEVDNEGQVLGGVAAARPRTVGKLVVDTPWSGVFREYQVFDGLRVPTMAEAIWDLPDGPFTYWRGQVTDLRALR